MKNKKLLICTLALAVMLPLSSMAQTDHFGEMDTITAQVAMIDNQHFTITISCFNDENLLGLSVPLKMSAGTNRIVADSAVYTGGRVEHFAYHGFRPDTAAQTVMLGMVANMGPTKNVLRPGHGRLATVFVSSFDKKPIEKVVIDTTTLKPNNSLMLVANHEDLAAITDSATSQLDKRVQIYPEFVVEYAKE